MFEIERKFLVTSLDFKKESFAQHHIAQGYLNSHPERSVRIRIKDNKGFITVKGIGNESGVSRLEWEKEITIDEANKLLSICEKGVIEKTRYDVKFGNHIVEVDEFHNENEGLIIAEIELKHEDEAYKKPQWLGIEVTGIEKYYNSFLVKKPYKNW